MKIRTRSVILGAIAALGILAIVARAAQLQVGQENTRPPANVATKIGGKHISIEYYAPSMHGRKVMDGLVPFGEVWCTGANWATKITTEANLEMGGLKLPAGSYSIWTIPNQNEWTLIINKQTGQFHLNYDSSRDFGRTKMNVKKLPAPVEMFTIEGRPDTGNKGTLAFLAATT